MSAKKTTTKKATKKTTAELDVVVINMGVFRGKRGSVTKKKAPEGYAIVNIIEGPEIMISKNFYK